MRVEFLAEKESIVLFIISQFMSPAARLNEAFSVINRVPVIHPSLPDRGEPEAMENHRDNRFQQMH
ncbi:hypothetical protein Leryth_016868 [Lithospermum erythrorhizon]|nr:hypothetical protein Leryth_016868 [Lithospermum erythrorhizon]